jgi:biotin operon repressor
MQSMVVMLAGIEWVPQEELIEAAGSSCTRLQDLFKRSPAWGVLVITDGKGGYRLVEVSDDPFPI